MNAPSSEPKKRRWNPWPVCITIYFTLGFAGCAFFVAFCNRHPADLVAADYYEKEVRYQAQMENMRRAEFASVRFDRQQQVIQISLAGDTAFKGASGSVDLYRPSATGLDRRVKLEPDTQGMQAIDASSLAPGLWKVRVSWTADKQDFFIDRRIDVARKHS
jgi:nitrogen fixation protein FixH